MNVTYPYLSHTLLLLSLLLWVGWDVTARVITSWWKPVRLREPLGGALQLSPTGLMTLQRDGGARPPLLSLAQEAADKSSAVGEGVVVKIIIMMMEKKKKLNWPLSGLWPGLGWFVAPTHPGNLRALKPPSVSGDSQQPTDELSSSSLLFDHLPASLSQPLDCLRLAAQLHSLALFAVYRLQLREGNIVGKMINCS